MPSKTKGAKKPPRGCVKVARRLTAIRWMFDISDAIDPRREIPSRFREMRHAEHSVMVNEFRDGAIEVSISLQHELLVHALVTKVKNLHKPPVISSSTRHGVATNSSFRWWSDSKLINFNTSSRNTEDGRVVRKVSLPVEITSNEYLKSLFRKNKTKELLRYLSDFFARLLFVVCGDHAAYAPVGVSSHSPLPSPLSPLSACLDEEVGLFLRQFEHSSLTH